MRRTACQSVSISTIYSITYPATIHSCKTANITWVVSRVLLQLQNVEKLSVLITRKGSFQKNNCKTCILLRCGQNGNQLMILGTISIDFSLKSTTYKNYKIWASTCKTTRTTSVLVTMNKLAGAHQTRSKLKSIECSS